MANKCSLFYPFLCVPYKCIPLSHIHTFQILPVTEFPHLNSPVPYFYHFPLIFKLLFHILSVANGKISSHCILTDSFLLGRIIIQQKGYIFSGIISIEPFKLLFASHIYIFYHLRLHLKNTHYCYKLFNQLSDLHPTVGKDPQR